MLSFRHKATDARAKKRRHDFHAFAVPTSDLAAAQQGTPVRSTVLFLDRSSGPPFR